MGWPETGQLLPWAEFGPLGEHASNGPEVNRGPKRSPRTYGPSIGRKLTRAGNGPCKSRAVNGYKENYCSLWARVTVGL